MNARIYRTDVIALKKILIDLRLEKISDLSKASNINRNTLSKILREEIQPSADVMDKLVHTLKLTPEHAGSIFFASPLRIA